MSLLPFLGKENRMVEAIEDGKIVKVSEEYARREGLLIIRKPEIKKEEVNSKKIIEPDRPGFDDFRRPLKKNSQVESELIENYHWKISQARRAKSLTRKQLAKDLAVSERDISLLENGTLYIKDFVLINKIQQYFGINLRKDGQDYTKSARALLNKDTKVKLDESNEEIDLFGDDIKIE